MQALDTISLGMWLFDHASANSQQYFCSGNQALSPFFDDEIVNCIFSGLVVIEVNYRLICVGLTV